MLNNVPENTFFSLKEQRLELWSQLLNALQMETFDTANQLLTNLSQIERYWAFPGYGVIAGLSEYLQKQQWTRAFHLTQNTLTKLQKPRLKPFQPYLSTLEELDNLNTAPLNTATALHPCFEVLILHPDPQPYLYQYMNSLLGLQTERDEVFYDIFFVTNLADAAQALLNNPNIQATVSLSGCPAESDLDTANQALSIYANPTLFELNQDNALSLLWLTQHIRPDIENFYIATLPFIELPAVYFDAFSRVFYHENPFQDLHSACLHSIRERFNAPFFNALHSYSQKPKNVFHALPISRGSSLKHSPWVADFYQFYGTNIFDAETSSTQGGLDSLLNPKGGIKSAQDKAQQAFGAQKTYFVTNGTSTSNKIVMQANLKPNDIVFVSSDCHKSVPYAVILTGAQVFFMQTNSVETYDLYGAIDLPQILTQMHCLAEQGLLHRLKMIVLTNSTFDGLTYDVETYMMAILALKPDIIFHWDEAWFAHAHFNPLYLSRHAMSVTQKLKHKFNSVAYRNTYHQATDKSQLPDPEKVCLRVYATQSTHKTLSSFRQGSMIHIFDDGFEEERFLDAYYTHTSTSPNYQILASLDIARRQMMIEGYQLTLKTLKLAHELRQNLRNIPSIQAYFNVLDAQDIFPTSQTQPQSNPNPDVPTPQLSQFSFTYYQQLVQQQQKGLLIDPTRITLDITKTGLTGNQFRKLLIDKYDIQVNKTSRYTVLFIINIGATSQTTRYLISVLSDIAEQLKNRKINIVPIKQIPMPQNRHYALPYQFTNKQQKSTLKNVVNLRKAYYDAFDEDNIEFIPVTDELLQHAKAGKTWVSASFVTPYPPGFPLFVPGQIIHYDGLLYFIDIMNDEIHGFQKQHGLKVFTQSFLRDLSHE